MPGKNILTGFILLLTMPVWAQFKPRVDYAVGAAPFSVAVADFNGDEHPDLAIANSGTDGTRGISVLLGNGDGTFKAHVDYDASNNPASILAADFNGDGKVDLAVTGARSNVVSILPGIGDGTFPTHVEYAVGTNPQWLVAADLNGDGRLDIATANYGPDYSSGGVSVLLGNGDGTFQQQVQYSAGVNPFGIMAADLDHDGRIDLAVVCNNGSYGVWILLGNGDGSFQSPTYYPSGYNPRVGVVSDFNSDGHLDIAIANCISNNISVLMGDGSGRFAPQVNYGAGSCPQTLAAGDFDGDGYLDLVTANSQTSNVSLFKGNGDGTFQSGGSFSVGNNAFWVSVADLNGDGAPDLVVTSIGDNSVSVLLNTGTDFQIAASTPSPATIKRGETAVSTVSLALLAAYGTPQVSLTCAVQPAESAPACSFSPNPAGFDNELGTSTLTLQTSARTTARSSFFALLWFPIAGFVLVTVGLGSSRRRPITCALGVLMVGSLMLHPACTGTSAVQSPPSQPQTYTITVTGTAGASQHSVTTTLTVK